MITQRQVGMAGAIGVLCSGLVLPGHAAAADQLRVGYVNLPVVFERYERTKAANATLEKKGSQLEAQREKIVASIQKLRDGLELLSAEAREDRQVAIQDEIRRLRDFERKAKRELHKERLSMAQEIGQEIRAAIQVYAREHAYDVVLPSKVVLFGPDEDDLTTAVVKRLNEQYR